jgi:RsiW-degrading membrane proteinase PrsW (M82 family)
MTLAILPPIASLWFYCKSRSANLTGGVLIISLLLTLFIGLAMFSPIILSTRAMAVP